MVTFKKVIVNKKWWGTYDVFKNSKRTGIVIHQDEQGKGDDFYCMVDVDSPYYFDFEPCTRKSLDTAKSYVKKHLEK